MSKEEETEFECKPYSELWMGAHKSNPSYTRIRLRNTEFNISEEVDISLIELIKKNSNKFLGDGNSFPFLMKVLSVRRALSLQTHPDKATAEELHKEYPDIYRDPNPKPEMCIALGTFEALCGFSPPQAIIANLNINSEILDLLEPNSSKILDNLSEIGKESEGLRCLIREITELEKNMELVGKCLEKMRARIVSKKAEDIYVSVHEELIVRLYEEFGVDIGIIISVVLQYYKLEAGEALIIGANEVHGYLRGECIECMAPSDNVIRLGLTPKFKDVPTFLRIINYTMTPKYVYNGCIILHTPLEHILEYKSPCATFRVISINLSPKGESLLFHMPGPSILVILTGSAHCLLDNTTHLLKQYDVYYIYPGTRFKLFNNSPQQLLAFFSTTAEENPFISL